MHERSITTRALLWSAVVLIGFTVLAALAWAAQLPWLMLALGVLGVAAVTTVSWTHLQACEAEGRERLRALSDAANAARKSSAEAVALLGTLRARLAQLDPARAVSGQGVELGQGLGELQRLDDQVHELLGKLAASLGAVAEHATGSSSGALEMVAASNEVGENIQTLVESADETSSNIEEMTFSIKEVARNIDELSSLAEETAAAMSQMDISITQVETNARETAKLSEQVTRDAEQGVDAIGMTLKGINRIRDTSMVSASAIATLGAKIEEIGAILNVIDEVAEQTNLLALNAAIIAAQAGEHGRGFAVVADEIKDLAERTGNSTKEIAALIRGVQEESKNVIGLIEQGSSEVLDGVKLGAETESALRKILGSVGQSTTMVKAIAQATVEQTQSSKQVTAAINKIAQNVQQISMATGEQAKGSEQLVRSAEKMRLIAQHVERSAKEQSKAGQEITQTLEAMHGGVRQTQTHQEQLHEVGQALHAALGRLDQLEPADGADAASAAAYEELVRHVAQLDRHLAPLASDAG